MTNNGLVSDFQKFIIRDGQEGVPVRTEVLIQTTKHCPESLFPSPFDDAEEPGDKNATYSTPATKSARSSPPTYVTVSHPGKID